MPLGFTYSIALMNKRYKLSCASLLQLRISFSFVFKLEILVSKLYTVEILLALLSSLNLFNAAANLL